jgi:capsular polysaccharide biosynthesis protein
LITEPTKSGKTIDKAIAGFGRCDTNWFHFNIETLPRILSASGVTEIGVPVLVQSDIPQSAVDAIIATTGREVVRIENDFIRVNELVVSQAKSATMDSAFLGTITGDFTASALASVKESLLKALPPEADGEKRIVLLRQGAYRRIKNVKKVLSVLNEHGFVSIDIASLTLREQISVINNAEVIVSQGGAGVTNMLFANEGARFLGLIGPAKNQSLFWENFLNVLNIRNSFIIGRHVGDKNRVLVHSDFVIPIKELRSTLQQL